MPLIPKRGAFIVLEGCDRAGKSTQCKRIVQALKKLGKTAEMMRFPDRSTACGNLIDAYLKNQQNFNDEAIHLLFSLNRWEAKSNIERLLHSGINLVVDRYSYSGVAFSSAKGLSLEWCKAPETGLPRPDLVLYLNLTQEAMQNRGDFGIERYEVPEFQRKVAKMFLQLKDDSYWQVVDADKTEDQLTKELIDLSLKAIEKAEEMEIQHLW